MPIGPGKLAKGSISRKRGDIFSTGEIWNTKLVDDFSEVRPWT
jgi:hypothetical protein